MMLRLLILTGLFSLTTLPLFSQSLEWAATGGSYGFDGVFSVVADNDGNVYSLGVFRGTVDFNEGGEEVLKTALSSDVFILKKNADGETVWVKTLESSVNSSATEIMLTDEGDLIISGNFDSTTDFDPGIGVEERTAIGGEDAFILKLDNSGTFIWVKTFGEGASVNVWGTVLDEDGNIITVGNFSDEVDFDPGLGEDFRTAGDFREIFVQKLDEDGDFIWVNHYANEANEIDIATDVQVTDGNNILVSGVYYGTIDFDLGVGVEELSSSVNGGAYTLKLNALGNLIWVQQITSESNQSLIRSLAVAPDGSIYVLGEFSGEMDLDPGVDELLFTSIGGSDIFIQKLNSSGELIWVKQVGSLANEFTARILYHQAGDVCAYVTYAGVIDADPSDEGVFELTAEGGSDVLCLVLNPMGEFVWAVSAGGSLNDVAIGFALDNNHNIYLGGYYAGTIDFNFGDGSELRTSNGEDDFFVLKMSETLSVNELVNDQTTPLIYPNPANDIVNIRTEGIDCVELINYSGKVLFSKTVTKDLEQINLSGYKKGIYFVRTVNREESQLIKLIVI